MAILYVCRITIYVHLLFVLSCVHGKRQQDMCLVKNAVCLDVSTAYIHHHSLVWDSAWTKGWLLTFVNFVLLWLQRPHVSR